jgi:hypothetical protein
VVKIHGAFLKKYILKGNIGENVSEIVSSIHERYLPKVAIRVLVLVRVCVASIWRYVSNLGDMVPCQHGWFG